MKRPLTPRQREVLDWIRRSIARRGFAPTFREIAEGIGARSTNTVACFVTTLERKGYLTRVKGHGSGGARSIRLTRDDRRAMLLDRVSRARLAAEVLRHERGDETVNGLVADLVWLEKALG